MSIELPDFQDMFKMVKEIKEKMLKEEMLKLEIKDLEAKTTLAVTSDQKYFVKGKPPSQSFIDSTYKYTGFDGEILSKREELVKISVEVEELKNTLQLYRDMVSVYQTESANKRAATML